MIEKKRGKGRPSQDKVMRPYTIDRKIAEFIDSLPDGERSKFVSSLLKQGVELEQLLGRFYNYVLMRPDGSVFYVGKGTGNRIDDHEKEARKGVQSHKCNVIRQVWSEGGEIIKQKVAFHNKEEDAFELEILLISFFGRENLTNLTNGGEGPTKEATRVAVSLSIANERQTWAIKQLQKEGIIEPTIQQISRYVKDWCYARIDKAMLEDCQ